MGQAMVPGLPGAALGMRAGRALLALGVLAATVTPVARAEQETGISVLGEGRVVTAPDLARVVIGVERLNPSLALAMAEASGAMEAVLARLLQLGVSREDVQTIRLSVGPVYDRRPDGMALRGYRVSNAVRVTIRGLEPVGTIIDGAVAAGAGQVEGVAFETSRLAELKDQARTLAVANARAKAEQLARLAGVSLGRVLMIQESDAGGVVPVRAATAAPAGEATPIEGGQLEISTSIRVTWQIN